MHQALYRKWRPMQFAEVIGQEHITRTLKGQAEAGRLSHAYLFCGTRGTGKTTCARILAKAINCELPQHGDPCNKCPACLSINDGSATDVIEIDAATYTGVNNIRELRDEAVYSPSLLRKRVYIIDEVHMLSTSAFNAFLKILEEPPSHVMFVLATTELHKVPATILSRCQRFDFHRIDRGKIAKRLLAIAQVENIPLEPGGAALLAHASDGAMRNALSLLEQAAAGSNGVRLDAETTSAVLGMVSAGPLLQLALAIGKGDASSALALFGEQYRAGAEPAAVMDRLSCLLRDLLICHMESKVELLGEGYSREDLHELLPKFSPGRLLYSVQTAQQALADLQRSPNRQISAEMCIVALARPVLGGEPAALAARLDILEHKLATGGFGMPATPAAKAESKPVSAERKAETSSKGQVNKKPTVQAATKPAEAKASSETPFAQRNELFALLRDSLDLGLLSHLKLCSLVIDGNRLTIQTAEPTTFTMVSRSAVIEAVSVAAAEILGHPVAVMAEVAKDRPAQKNEVDENDPFAALLQFAEDNPDLVDLK